MSLPLSLQHGCALALIAKVSVLGTGSAKPQPSPPLTQAEASALKSCFLRDLAANLSQIADSGRAEAVIVYTPAEAESPLRQLLPQGLKLFPQRGRNLGEVLANATEDLLNRGFPAVCLINADCVTLPPSFLNVAIDSLARPGDRMVIGGAEPGGYSLIGLKEKHRSLFDRVISSTSDIVLHTTTRAASMGLRVEMLPPWYEVNDEQSLNRLCIDLLGPAREKTPHAPFTRQYLTKLIETDGPGRISPGLAHQK